MPRTTTRIKITKDFAVRLLIRERKKNKINSNLGRALKIAIDALKKEEKRIDFEKQRNEIIQTWSKVHEYAFNHPEAKVGHSVSGFVLELMKERDELKKEKEGGKWNKINLKFNAALDQKFGKDIKTPEEVLASNWKKITDKPFDNTTLTHLNYAVNAISEYHNQFQSLKPCGCMTHCNCPIVPVSDKPDHLETLREYFYMCEDLVGFAGPVENVKTALLKKLNITDGDCQKKCALTKLNTIKNIAEELSASSGHVFSEHRDQEALLLREHSRILRERYLILKKEFENEFVSKLAC